MVNILHNMNHTVLFLCMEKGYTVETKWHPIQLLTLKNLEWLTALSRIGDSEKISLLDEEEEEAEEEDKEEEFVSKHVVGDVKGRRTEGIPPSRIRSPEVV